MANTYGLVTVQICILIIFGLWPLWSRPFTRNKIRNILNITYSGILLILNTWAFVIQVYTMIEYVAQSHASLATLLSRLLPVFCGYGIVISLFHISLFKFSHLSNHLQLLTSYNSRNRKFTIYLIVGTLYFLSLHGYIAFAWLHTLSELTSGRNELFEKFILTGTKAEAHLYFFISILHVSSAIRFIPIIIILGLSIVIREEYRVLKSQILDAIKSKKFCYPDTTLFSSLKKKYEEICDTVTYLDETFRYYILLCAINVLINIFVSIYYQNVSCFPSNTFVTNLLLYSSTFLILCTSGVMVASEVSELLHLQ